MLHPYLYPVRVVFSSDERGVVIPLMTFLLVVLLALTGMLLDNERQEIAALQLQNIADAASLAGARRLDGTEAGWKNAKRAALAVIRNSGVLDAGEPLGALSTFSRGVSDAALLAVPEDPAFLKNEATVGNIEITFERGVYWQSEPSTSSGGENEFLFRSLEGEESSLRSQFPFLRDGILTRYNLANAVRVRIVHAGIKGTLWRMFDRNYSLRLSRSAVAASDSNFETCVAPIAIPACELKLIMNPDSTQFYSKGGLNIGDQCPREIVAAEADIEVPERWHGITRSESYPRPPYIAGRNELNTQRGYPVRAFLALPSSSPGSASPGEIAGALKEFAQSGKDCLPIKARLGMHVRPLDRLFESRGVDPTDPDAAGRGPVPNIDALFTRHEGESELENALAALIHRGRSFRSVFMTDAGPKPNYPWLRRYRPELGMDANRELMLTWPLNDDTLGLILLADMGGPNGTDWANPMCHSRKVRYANDLDRAKAKDLVVMVVAPAGEGVMYCDPERQFAGEAQRSRPPTGDTRPVIVGFVRMNLFDFNVRDLSTKETGGHDGTDTTPYYSEGNIRDRNPRAAYRGGLYRIGASSGSCQTEWEEHRRRLQQWRECRFDRCNLRRTCDCLRDSEEDERVRAWDICRWDCLDSSGDEQECPFDGPTRREDQACVERELEQLLKSSAVWGSCSRTCDSVRCTGCGEKPRPPQNCGPPQDHADRAQSANGDGYSVVDDLRWFQNCFRPLNEFRGVTYFLGQNTGNRYRLRRIQDPGRAHPILNDDWKDFFWDDPERFYRELTFTARILSGFYARPFDATCRDQVCNVPIPPLQDILSDRNLFNWWIDELRKPLRFDRFERRYREWINIFNSLKQFRAYQGREGSINRISPPPFSPEENSELLLELAGMLGEDLSAYGVSRSDLQESPERPVIRGYPDEDEVNQVLDRLNLPSREGTYSIGAELSQWRRPSLPGHHCLPKKIDNRFPANSPESWQQPTYRPAQFGCGGLRLRLDCDSGEQSGSRSFTSIDLLRNVRPVLVKNVKPEA